MPKEILHILKSEFRHCLDLRVWQQKVIVVVSPCPDDVGPQQDSRLWKGQFIVLGANSSFIWDAKQSSLDHISTTSVSSYNQKCEVLCSWSWYSELIMHFQGIEWTITLTLKKTPDRDCNHFLRDKTFFTRKVFSQK